MSDNRSQMEKACPKCRSPKVRRTGVVLALGRPSPAVPQAPTTRTTSYLCKDCNHAWDDARVL